MNWEDIITALKDPNTQKLIVTLAGISGVAIDPTMVNQLILGILAVNQLLNVIHRKQLTNPKPPADPQS